MPRSLVEDTLPRAWATDLVSTPTAARRVLFSWTTNEQAEALRSVPTLLTRWTSPTHGASYVDVFLRERARQGVPIASLLREPRFRRARFAWVSAWATVLGWEGETYGTRLLRVTLRPDALTVIVSSHERAWQLVDFEGNHYETRPLAPLADRIAVVYFTHLANAGAGSFANVVDPQHAPPGAYRDYMLVNERMIEQWELDTPACIAEVVRSRHVASLLPTLITPSLLQAEPYGARLSLHWAQDHRSADAPRTPYDHYPYALSMLSTRYAPTLSNFAALQAVLDAVTFGPPLTHIVREADVRPPPRELLTTDTEPPATVTRRRPAVSVPRCQGTMCPPPR
jgi:hypothetical protein